jgi:hypothetical protein
MRRSAAGLAVFVLMSAPARMPAQNAGKAPSLSAARVTAQLAAGTVATPVAFVVGGLAARRIARAVGAGEATASRAAYAGAYASTWVAAAGLPAVIGRDGRFSHALAGSALGMAAAWGVTRVGNRLYDGDRRACGPFCWTLGALTVVLPSVGATLLYDDSRR